MIKCITYKYLHKEHLTCPSPVKPGRHVQAISCTVVEHIALSAQSFTIHALMQDPVWHTSEFLQSSCLKHSGVAVTRKYIVCLFHNFSKNVPYVKCKIRFLWIDLSIRFLPFTHSPDVPDTDPSGQTQPTVRIGKLSVTTHVWAPLQGFLTIHGFWQRWSIHACLDGQSPSTRHSGSTGCGAVS